MIRDDTDLMAKVLKVLELKIYLIKVLINSAPSDRSVAILTCVILTVIKAFLHLLVLHSGGKVRLVLHNARTSCLK